MSDVSCDGIWVVVEYKAGDDLWSPVRDSPELTLTIDGNHIAGKMGVNRLAGRLDGGSISGPLATTRMAGPPELMDQEQTLLALLGRVDEICVHELSDGKGMTMRGEGLELVKLRLSGTIATDGSS